MVPEEPQTTGHSGDSNEVDPSWVWQRLFDAMISCRTAGFEWEEVYNWNVDEFTDVYHAMQRNDARAYLRDFSALSQAYGGDKKSITKFVENASIWLPAHERNGGAKGRDDFVSLIKKGVNLKKK